MTGGHLKCTDVQTTLRAHCLWHTSCRYLLYLVWQAYFVMYTDPICNWQLTIRLWWSLKAVWTGWSLRHLLFMKSHCKCLCSVLLHWVPYTLIAFLNFLSDFCSFWVLFCAYYSMLLHTHALETRDWYVEDHLAVEQSSVQSCCAVTLHASSGVVIDNGVYVWVDTVLACSIHTYKLHHSLCAATQQACLAAESSLLQAPLRASLHLTTPWISSEWHNPLHGWPPPSPGALPTLKH